MTANAQAPSPGDERSEAGRSSEAIARLSAACAGRDVSAGAIVAGLEGRGLGLVMVLFALPNAVIPGISFILGAPVLLLALQLARGRQDIWLPRFMERRTLSPALFQRIAARTAGFLVWVERYTRRRWGWLVSGSRKRVLGFFIAVVAAFLMMPVPFGNALPALGIALMAVGLIEEDGVAAAVGLLLGLLGVIYIAAVLIIGVEALKAAVPLMS